MYALRQSAPAFMQIFSIAHRQGICASRFGSVSASIFCDQDGKVDLSFGRLIRNCHFPQQTRLIQELLLLFRLRYYSQ